MEHKGWDIEDERWIRLDYLWLISAEILIRVRPQEIPPPIIHSSKCSRSLIVDELRVGLLSSGCLRVLALSDDNWEASRYCGTYWYGLYTGSGDKADQTS